MGDVVNLKRFQETQRARAVGQSRPTQIVRASAGANPNANATSIARIAPASAGSASDRRRGRIMKSPVVKRSIVVAGHKTSVSLEEAFWNGMKEISGLAT